ncbi:hypothetical protein EXW35_31945 (plasmid) [Bacillus mycoides]|nr:hypothetical protein EXW35_31945 [Bacillus mycoides]
MTETILIFIILYFFVKFLYKTIYNRFIYIEKFIAKLSINDSRSECKLLAKSLLSFFLKH